MYHNFYLDMILLFQNFPLKCIEGKLHYALINVFSKNTDSGALQTNMIHYSQPTK